MARLNLNFHQSMERHEPTENEIFQLANLSISIKSVIESLDVYCLESKGKEKNDVCLGVCHALELLIDPIIDYLNEYAGNEASYENEPNEVDPESSDDDDE